MCMSIVQNCWSLESSVMLAMAFHENIHLRNEQRPNSHRLTLKGKKITPLIPWAFHLTPFFSFTP